MSVPKKYDFILEFVLELSYIMVNTNEISFIIF